MITLAIKYGSEMLNNSQVEKIVGKILGLFMISIKTVLQIPFLFLIISGCSQAFDNKNLIIALSVTLLVLSIPFFIFVIFALSDSNPFSNLVFAGENHIYRIANLTIKLGLVLYSVLDQKKSS